MRDAAKWEYESAQNAQERQTNLAIAALGNEAASDQGRADILKTLGGFAMDIWAKFLQINKKLSIDNGHFE